MELVVVRHGIAMDRDEAASHEVADADRPLTPKGRSRMKRAARGLCARAPGVTMLLSSPLLRAIETADILHEAYGELKRSETAALLPEADPAELMRALARRAATSTVAIVGHEPQLGCFMSFCLTGDRRSFFELQKGGAGLLRFDGAAKPGAGRLIWFLPPAVLRSL
jgi:phosphohistidine phosphatase